MSGGVDIQGFVETRTEVQRAPLCPDLRVRLATEVTPLWQATEEYLCREGLAPPYWAFCWPGGQAIARCLLDRPELVRGLRVLDFGAGCGIASIAAVKAGAAVTTAADIDPMAAAAMALNASLNDVSFEILIEDVLEITPRWDVILAGDVCYERRLADPLVAWLRRLSRSGVEVILADPGRAYLPTEGLSKLAEYRVATSLDLEDAEYRDAVVYRMDGRS